MATNEAAVVRQLRRYAGGVGFGIITILLSGCADFRVQRSAPDEAPVVMGPAVRVNRTPYEEALACFGRAIREAGQPRLAIAVGDVRDFTGKYSINEGNTVTQGGSLMIYSALDKLGGAVRVIERFDTRIAEAELGYIDRRQLGDGRVHTLDAQGRQQVPWMPYFGGSITKSDYYIVGGITELNQNISSGGVQVAVDTTGPRARTYTQSVAVDLRIVDSRTLSVVRSISLQKQMTGFEVGLGIFRFFGSELFDVNVGNKSQEPLQLGIRATLEEATMSLVGAVSGQSPEQCLTGVEYRDPGVSATQLNAALPRPKPVAGVHERETPLPSVAVAQSPAPGAQPPAAAAAVAVAPAEQREAASPATPVDRRGRRVRRAEGRPAMDAPAPEPAASMPAAAGAASPVAPAAQSVDVDPPAAPAEQGAGAVGLPPAPQQDATPAASLSLGSVVPENLAGIGGGSRFEIAYELNSESIGGSAASVVEQIVQSSVRRRVEVVLLARISETNDPAMRNRLANARVNALQRTLGQRGIRSFQVQWMPSPSAPEIVPMHGGNVLVARIVVHG